MYILREWERLKFGVEMVKLRNERSGEKWYAWNMVSSTRFSEMKQNRLKNGNRWQWLCEKKGDLNSLCGAVGEEKFRSKWRDKNSRREQGGNDCRSYGILV